MPCFHKVKKHCFKTLRLSFFWIRIIFLLTVTFVVIFKIVKLETLYLFSFSMILFKKYPLNSPINSGLIRITNLVFTNISQLKKKTSFYWTKKHFFFSWKNENKCYKILEKKIGKNKIGRFLVWSDELVTTFKLICCCWFLALVCSLE